MMVVPFSNISMVPGSWDPRRRCLTVLGEGDNSTSMATGERPRGGALANAGGRQKNIICIYIYILYIYLYLFIYI